MNGHLKIDGQFIDDSGKIVAMHNKYKKMIN